jgi:hypothetical protein
LITDDSQLNIFALDIIGNLSTGGFFANGNAIGTLTSIPGYNLTLNASTVHMDDFNTISPGGPYTLAARGLLKTNDGEYIGISGLGLLANTTHVADVLANKTRIPTQWGELETITSWNFQASQSGKYNELTQSLFVANIRLLPSDNPDTVLYIDYKLSRVIAGPACIE